MFVNYNDWSAFINEGRGTPAISPPLLESWKRSRQSGLGPQMYPQKKATIDVTAQDVFLQQVSTRLSNLLKFIGPDTNLAGLICDINGCIVNMETGTAFAGTLETFGLHPGIVMSEESAGTTAVSLAAALQTTVVCHGAEHYLEKLHPLGGSATPVYDIDGQLKGFVALYGILPDVNVHLLKGLIVLLIQLLDRQTRLFRSKKMHNELKWQLAKLFKDDRKPMLLVTRSGYLRQINPPMMRLLNLNGSADDEKNPDNLARFYPAIREIAKTAIPCKEQPMEIRLSRRKLRVNYERIPLFSDKDEFLGCLLIFDEKKTERAPTDAPRARFNFDDILGNSPALLHAKELAMLAAETSVNVFLHGASGTGKEMFAHSIHNHSERRDAPFIPVNCAAIPREIAESELFGYDTGAFTGARKEGNIGLLETANGGTVFLDEIGDMPLEIQAKLLRLLEDKTITRIGSRAEIPVNIRIIAASNRNIPELIETGKFREDLYYRLNVTAINLPLLTECLEDIPELTASFISHFNEIMGKKVPGIMPQIMERFRIYNWPGNIRELKNAIEFAVMLNSGEQPVAWKDLPGELRAELLYRDAVTPPATHDPFGRERQEIQNREKALYEKAVLLAHGNLSKAATRLKVSRSTLYRKLKKYGIPGRH